MSFVLKTKWQNGGPPPQILKYGIAERRNPPLPPASPPPTPHQTNLKRQNEGKSPEILNDGKSLEKMPPVLGTRGVGKSEKRQGFGNFPSPCKIMLLFVVRTYYPLEFYYRFPCSIHIVQSNKATESAVSTVKGRVVTLRHGPTMLVPSAYDPSGLRQESRALGATILK